MKVDPLSSLGFIPMDGWAFRLFMAGAKDTEFRVLGGRFVAKHYPVGRLVVISSGYGRTTRALTRVRAFDVLDAPPDLEQWARVYGTWKTWTGRKVAAIGLDVLAPLQVNPFSPGWFSFYGSEWVDFDGVQRLVQEIPPDVWSGPRVQPGRVHQSAILFHDLVDKALRSTPIGGCSICDCTTLVADELPDSDEFRRAYDAALHGGFLEVGPEVVTLDRDGLRVGPSGPFPVLQALVKSGPLHEVYEARKADVAAVDQAGRSLLESVGLPGEHAAETDDATRAFVGRHLPGLVESNPGPVSRLEAAYLSSPEPSALASLPATFEDTAAQIAKAGHLAPSRAPGSPQALPEK